MTKVCLLVLAGGFAAQHSRVPIDSDHGAALFVAVIIFAMFRRLRWFAYFLLGFLLFMHAGKAIIEARLDARYSGDSMLTQVRIADFPKSSGDSVSMLVEPVQNTGRGPGPLLQDKRLPPRSRVSWYDPPQVPEIGEVWELELRLRQPHGNSNPGGFSLENWMFREDLHASGYVVSGKRNRRISGDSLSAIEAYRRDFVRRAKAIDARSSPVLAAIGVGTRHLISRQQWDRFAKTGSSHLMAISGLHIGLAAGAAFFLIAWLSGLCRLAGNHLDHATIGAACMAVIYALLSGFAVPSQRATLMLGLAAIAFLCRRRADPWRIISQVALLVYALDPVSMMMPGFGLSFGAVLVLLWIARRYWPPTVKYRVSQLLTMQFALLLGLMPLTVLVFQRIAFVAPLVNLLTVPVFSFVTVPLTLLSMILGPLWEALSVLLLQIAAASVRGIEWVIDLFANLELADVTIAGVGAPIGAIGCMVFLPALWVVLPRGWPGRWIAMLAVIAIVLHKPLTPPKDCIDASVLDVGQGLAVVIQSARHTLLFDTGASYRGGGSAAAQFVVPYLRHKGIDALDWLVVSHADDDHAGGLSALLNQLAVGRVFAGEDLPGVDGDILHCRYGQFWRADGIEYRFLHPGPESRFVGNDSSCVLVISAGDHHLILPGDIESNGEQSVLPRIPFAAASVVLMPHHGSLTSSTPAFVNRLQPDIAIASVGYSNRWGFPKERVLKRWEGTGAAVLDTASSGAISFRLCQRDGVSRLREQRLDQRRFWHHSGKL